MRKYIAAGNWKLNKNTTETLEFTKELAGFMSAKTTCEVIISPVALQITNAVSNVKGTTISVAAQNCYHENSGAFTGELSPNYIKDCGCSHVIIGHSERRTIFKETDSDLNKKVRAALAEGLIPIFCIGETLAEREANQVEQVLEHQLTYGLEGIDFNGSNMIIAYEPVWAIGTGKVASKEDAQKAHAFVRSVIAKQTNQGVADSVRILYGGSVKPGNIAELIAQKDIDGALIGGASLKIPDFTAIIDSITEGQK